MAKQVRLGDEKVIRAGPHGKALVGKPNRNAISGEQRASFLDHLSCCSNVRASAAAVGLRQNALYRMRHRDPEFAAQWQDALTAGYATIEALLLERARLALEARRSGKNSPDDRADGTAPVDGPDGNQGGGGGADALAAGDDFALSMDSDQILKLLAAHRRTINGTPRGGRRPGPAASEAEACEAIRKKLDALRKRIDAKKA
jgi:hypothetical protein